MESQGYLFHELTGKFPLLGRKAIDGECYFFFFFSNIPAMLLYSQNFIRFLFLLVELPQSTKWHFSPVSAWRLQLQLQRRLSHNSSGSDGSQSWMHLLRLDTAHPSWSKNNRLKLPTCSRATLSNVILQGVTPPCHTDFLDVDIVVWVNICCCYSTVVSFRLSRSKDENMFWCLPPACSIWEALCICPELLNSCDQMTPYPLLSLKHQFNSQLLAHWIPTTSGIITSGYLSVHVAVIPSFHINIPEPKPRGNYALLCSRWKWWRNKRTNKLIWL